MSNYGEAGLDPASIRFLVGARKSGGGRMETIGGKWEKATALAAKAAKEPSGSNLNTIRTEEILKVLEKAGINVIKDLAILAGLLTRTAQEEDEHGIKEGKMILPKSRKTLWIRYKYDSTRPDGKRKAPFNEILTIQLESPNGSYVFYSDLLNEFEYHGDSMG